MKHIAYEAILVPDSDDPITSLGVHMLFEDYSEELDFDVASERVPIEIQRLEELSGVKVKYTYRYDRGLLLLEVGDSRYTNHRINNVVGLDSASAIFFSTALFMRKKEITEL